MLTGYFCSWLLYGGVEYLFCELWSGLFFICELWNAKIQVCELWLDLFMVICEWLLWVAVNCDEVKLTFVICEFNIAGDPWYDNLKKKFSLLQHERNSLETENKRLRDQPAVPRSLKDVQLQPVDLSTNRGTLPSLVPYLETLKKLRQAGGLEPD